MIKISIHAPHTRSDKFRKDQTVLVNISIHAPHTRSDGLTSEKDFRRDNFNPRSSYEERQVFTCKIRRVIHFNPRSSYEERRHILDNGAERPCGFQSTLLIRGATTDILGRLTYGRISIHAPHTRSDWGSRIAFASLTEFQSTLLIRGATRPASHSDRSLP